MNPSDPGRESRGEETADWPTGQPAQEAQPQDPEVTLPTRRTPRNFHEETTLDAAQFRRPAQPPPGYQQVGQPGSGGNRPPYQQPTAWPPGYQQPPQITPVAKPSVADRFGPYRWWLIGGAAALAIVLVIALIVAGSGGDDAPDDGPPTSPAQVPAGPTTTVPASPTAAPSAPPSQPPPPIPWPTLGVEALPGLLLPAEQISERMNTPGMESMPVVHRPLPGSLTPVHCTGAWGPAYADTYNGSGFTGIAVQGTFKQPAHQLVQAVVSFPDPRAAKQFYVDQGVAWIGCKDVHVRYEKDGVTEADIGAAAFTGDILSVMVIPTTSKVAGQQCEHSMAQRGNVVVDVRACSPTVGSAGLSITRAIADKISPPA